MCDSLLEEARSAEDWDEFYRLKRIRSDATIELAEHRKRLATRFGGPP